MSSTDPAVDPLAATPAEAASPDEADARTSHDVDTDADVDTDLDELDEAYPVFGRPVHRYGLGVRMGAEALGSFGVVLAVVGVLLYLPLNQAGSLGVALAGGLALAGAVAALGHVSGGHIIPAVSLAAALAGRVRALDAVLYVVAQVLGAVAAVVVLYLTIPAELPGLVGGTDAGAFLATAANGFGEGSPLSTLSTGQVTFGLVAVLLLEVAASAVLVAVALGVGRGVRDAAASTAGAVALGLTYAAMLLVTSPVSNGSLNSARATAVALVSAPSDTAALAQLWVFWVAPFIGAAVVGLAVLAFGHESADREIIEIDEDGDDLITVR